MRPRLQGHRCERVGGDSKRPDAPGFENFPDRLAYTLSHTFVDRIQVEPIVFPTYRTAGNFQDAVYDLVNRLVNQVGEREAALAAGGPSKGACGIILMGHRCVGGNESPFRLHRVTLPMSTHASSDGTDALSMGGLVSADATLSLAGAFAESEQVLWPRVLGVLSYDTPWLGVHPAVFANTADQAITYGSQATQVATAVGSALGIWGAKKSAAPPAPASSAAKSGSAVAAQTAGKSGWMGMVPVVAGGAAVAAAAGAALWHRKAISQFAWLGWDGVSSHLQFVGELWKTEALRNRLDRIVALDDNGGHNRVGFHWCVCEPATALIMQSVHDDALAGQHCSAADLHRPAAEDLSDAASFRAQSQRKRGERGRCPRQLLQHKGA